MIWFLRIVHMLKVYPHTLLFTHSIRRIGYACGRLCVCVSQSVSQSVCPLACLLFTLPVLSVYLCCLLYIYTYHIVNEHFPQFVPHHPRTTFTYILALCHTQHSFAPYRESKKKKKERKESAWIRFSYWTKQCQCFQFSSAPNQ